MKIHPHHTSFTCTFFHTRPFSSALAVTHTQSPFQENTISHEHFARAWENHGSTGICLLGRWPRNGRCVLLRCSVVARSLWLEDGDSGALSWSHCREAVLKARQGCPSWWQALRNSKCSGPARANCRKLWWTVKNRSDWIMDSAMTNQSVCEGLS